MARKGKRPYLNLIRIQFVLRQGVEGAEIQAAGEYSVGASADSATKTRIQSDCRGQDAETKEEGDWGGQKNLMG